MKFYSPMSFLFLLAGIPIIIMYLLKKQHKEMKIPSTFLWQKVLRDIEANTPWQKLRKNMLLLLQLLIVICIVFFLTNPYILSSNINSENMIIILDKSASMQAVDVGKSRFDVAKDDIENIINNLKPNTLVTLITMEENPQMVVKTKEKSVLKRKLKELSSGNGSDSLEETLSMTKAISKDNKNTKILMYTDKGISKTSPNMVIKKIKGNGENIGIENISSRIDEKGISVLTTVTNYSDVPFKNDIFLYGDENIIDVKEISIKPNESKNIYWDGVEKDVDFIKVEIDIEDDLKVDNTRYHIIKSTPMSKVLLISPKNIFLEKAIGINKYVTLYKSNENIEDVSGYDLYVYDSILPKKLPSDGNIVIFNPPNNNKNIHVLEEKDNGSLKMKNDSLFESVNLDFAINKLKTLEVPKWATPVLFSDEDAVMIKGKKGNQKIIVVGFDLHATDFPLKIDFPIFIQNLLDYSLHLNKQNEVEVLAGKSIEIDGLAKAEEVFVKNPSGKIEKIGPPFPLVPYRNTQKVGVYTIEQRSKNEVFKNYFASNIDTVHESDIDFEYKDIKNNIDESNGKVQGSRDFKNIFLALGLVFLSIEWVVYNRGY